MRENVPLLECNDLRSDPGTIKRELEWPEGGAWMLLSDGDLHAGSTNAGGSDGVLPG
ncbi:MULTISPECIES: hypothetical protein [Arthrobacter]|uniref:hypothetical protein n=1 Tax=Arthrobacter TaxID=1663 RepID=UPI0012FC372A|nr:MULTISPECIES: hypothetical protein [Arthrobacter]